MEIYGKLLGASRTEKVTVLEQTKIDQQFFRRHVTRAPYQAIYYNPEIKAKNEKIARK